MTKLSVVTTMYNSERYLREFCRRSCASAEAMTKDYELILVNDGSPDGSLALAKELVDANPRIRVVSLSRNFGHHKALMTGLNYSRGEKIFFIDCDLEEDPAIMKDFSEIMKANNADSVYGFQASRAGGWFEFLSGHLFYKMFNWLSHVKIPVNMLGVRLMNRKFVDALLAHQESAVFMAGLYASVGFRQVGVPVQKEKRGETSYSFMRRLRLMANGIVSFSSRPLEMIFMLGLTISLLSTLYIFGLFCRYLIQGVSVPGYLTVVVSVWLLGGIITFCLGIVAIYLSKVFQEVKHRPYTVIMEQYSSQPEVSNERHDN